MSTVETVLHASPSLMTISQIRETSGLEDSVVRAELRQLAKRGQIEHIPGRGRYDGKYGLLRTTPQAPAGEHVDGAANDETANLRASLAATEQRRLATTAALTAAMKQLDAIRAHLSPFPADPSGMTEVELAEHAAAAIRDGLDRIFSKSADDGTADRLASDLRADLANAKALNEKLEHLLGSERTACAALREQLDGMISPTLESITPSGYLVRAPKRAHRIVTKQDRAQAHAMAAAANGSGRGEVFALVHVGSAKRGAVWSPK